MPFLLLLLLRPFVKPLTYLIGFVLLSNLPGFILKGGYGMSADHAEIVNGIWGALLFIGLLILLTKKLVRNARRVFGTSPRQPRPAYALASSGGTPTGTFIRAYPCPYCRSYDCNTIH